MKQNTKQLLLVLLLVTCSGLLSTERMAGQRIRVVLRTVEVSDDSLRIRLDMDLTNVRVGSGMSVTFTPVLQRKQETLKQLALPPVVVTGRRRERMDRRQRFLSPDKAGIPPFAVLCGNDIAKMVDYKVAVPYASWMRQASLLLKQEYKECCDPELLGVDTLQQNMALAAAPTAVSAATPASRKIVKGIPATVQEIKMSVASVTGPEPAMSVIPASRKVAKRSVAATDSYIPMVSFLTPDTEVGSKNRVESIVLYIDYPLGKDDVFPDYKNNRKEIDKADGIISPLLNNAFSDVRKISIRGYASPDGNYQDNERLASVRSIRFGEYVQIAYKIPRNLIETSSVAEDWDGLIELLHQNKPAYADAALDIIARYGIFSGREKKLMDLQGGTPYKDMLRRFFPKLRRIEMVVQYQVRNVDVGEASELIYTHPDLLSLQEIYNVARYYRPGTDQYREVYEIAAYHFPNDVVANVNAASAVMLTGDLQSAWNYLRKVESDPRSWNNMGVLTLMEGDPEGAAVWFRKAVGVEPRKARTNLQVVRELVNQE